MYVVPGSVVSYTTLSPFFSLFPCPFFPSFFPVPPRIDSRRHCWVVHRPPRTELCAAKFQHLFDHTSAHCCRGRYKYCDYYNNLHKKTTEAGNNTSSFPIVDVHVGIYNILDNAGNFRHLHVSSATYSALRSPQPHPSTPPAPNTYNQLLTQTQTHQIQQKNLYYQLTLELRASIRLLSDRPKCLAAFAAACIAASTENPPACPCFFASSRALPGG